MGRIGVCSWSLLPSGPADLAGKAALCGVEGVQLALDPIQRGEWSESETVGALRAAGVSLFSGMMVTHGEDYSTLEAIRTTGGVRLDRHWGTNLAAAKSNAQIAARLGLGLVTLHAGFLPHDSADPERKIMLDRLRQIASAFADRGVRVAFETGQETASTLVGVLRDLARPDVGVNFDPANMILYGMGDPLAAIQTLAPWVRQVHIKDATPTTEAGTWGNEQPVGKGSVPWPEFLAVVSKRCPGVDLVIEREGGVQRIEDVQAARAVLQRVLPPRGASGAAR
jgi:sugar phosphate isomerase/epimerase